ncbi:MAG TPA: EAL domain-containing protein [Burkholderiaceae bacterium]
MPLRRARALLDRHLEWRLLAVFLAAALIPLAASDWIATSVLDGIVQRIGHDRDNLAARTVARQVFDRLLLSRTLLLAVDEAPGTARARLAASAAGPQGAFSHVACGDSQDAQWAGLQAQWAAARSGASAPAQAGLGAGLRLAPAPSGNAGLLMATGPYGAPRCIAILNPDHVWETVHDQADDSAWHVRADDGSDVLAWHGVDARPGDAAGAARFSTHLFLGSEFGAGNWTLEQRTPPRTVGWHGMPVGVWLACVAAATLLLIGLAARSTIRRTLAPLAALTDGARRLAAGIEPARVEVRRDDELGKLATSFNDMASQLEQRIASLRALGQIDAGILQGTPFTDLACGVLERLASVRPDARVAVAWPVSPTLLATVRYPAPVATGAERDEICELRPDAMARFTDLDDGLLPVSTLHGLEAVVACDPADLHAAPCLVLGVRDGQANRALITIHGIDLEAMRDEAQSLRDRLAVAVVARDRQDRLEHRATHDPLTGLNNTDGLQRALAPLLEGDDDVAVLFIDLDHFKDVNDCYGHATGDRLLQAAARRLRRGTADGALISRSGGDEFVVVLPATDAAQARRTAERILESLNQPFIIAATEHRTGASIGIAMYPAHALDREDLLRCADIAMYESKRLGRNRATVFEPALDTQVRERNELLSALAHAVERSEFVLHYQPRLDAATGRVAAAEALVRWQHPERGLLLPGVFIDLAETSGHIDALGRNVMASAIARIAQWHNDGRSIERISVNVSQHQFADGQLVSHVQALLRQHGVPGTRLEIEVTESVLGGDIASVRRQLHQLRDLGVTVAMDDFGTGYSSLAQLRTLPIDVMKVDRAFVKDLETDPAAVAIVRTIVTLARELGLQVVAEGIETPAQAALLAAIGCDQFQGFLYSRPVPPDECAALGPFEMPPAGR